VENAYFGGLRAAKKFNSKFSKNCLTIITTCYILYKRFAERGCIKRPETPQKGTDLEN
jgi:hypothetical protein